MGEQVTSARPRDRIEHVIVLMMENRSFDHLCGYIQHDSPAYPRLDRLQESCPVDPERPKGLRVPTSSNASYVLGTDPDHSHQAVMLQIFGREGTPGVGPATMSGFVASYRKKIQTGTLRPQQWWQRFGGHVLTWLKGVWRRVSGRPGPIRAEDAEIMACFPEAEIPVLAALVKDFAVMVNWHASVPGETWPNRQFAHAATSHGTANIEADFYRDRTVFESLGAGDRSWEIYHDGVAQVWAYPELWENDEFEHFHSMDKLYADIAAGSLPDYAFVEPNHGYGRGEGNSQHPANNTSTGDSFLAGEALIAQLYNALVAEPELFASTLLLITYDEHGGFYDHVPARSVVRPDEFVDAGSGFDFSLSGVRVPAVAVSPLIPAGTVDPTFYEHASIPATLRRQFIPAAEPLNPRDAAAADLLDHLPLLAEPRSDLQPIPVGPLRAGTSESAVRQPLDDFQASLVDLAGAAHVARKQRGPESLGPAPYVPDPSTREAADKGFLVPGSRAEQVVEDMVADSTRESDVPDPTDTEFGTPPGGGQR